MGRSARVALTIALAIVMIGGQQPSVASARNAAPAGGSAVATVAAAPAAALGSASALAPIQLGQVAPPQLNPPAGNGCGGCTLFQGQTDPASPSYAAPVDGIITSWSVQGPSDGCATCVVRLRIFRQIGPGQFLTVADSADQTVAAGLNTFAANIAIRAGDMLGIRATDGIRWYAGNSADQIKFVSGDPTPGATTTPQGSCTTSSCWFYDTNGNGARTNVAATLRPVSTTIQLGQVAPPQVNPPAGSGCSGCTLFQTQTDPASPIFAAPVDGVITSWSVQGPSDGCTTCVVRLRIFRQTAPGSFLTVADSADQTVAAGLNTFTANIAVRAGDMLGIRATDGIRWYAANVGDKITFISGDPGPGVTTSTQCPIDTSAPPCYFFPSASSGNLTNIAATLRPLGTISGTARCGDSIASSATLRSGGVVVASQSGLKNGSFTFTGTAPRATYTLDYAQWTVTLNSLVLAFSCSVSVTTDSFGNATAPAGSLIPDLGNHSFPKAFPLTNGAGQADYMAVAGRPNWYKISIAPGQRLSVTVRGATGGQLPADLVLTLFADIPVREAADRTALSGSGDPLAVIRRSDAGVAPDGLSPDGLSPDGLSPDGLSPDGLSPDGLSPDGLSPDGLSPDGLSPDGLSPDGLSPDGLSPDGLSPDGLSSLYTSAQTESLLRVSDKPGTEPEAVLQNTWSNSGTYYIRVRGHNGAFSASDPYTVAATLTTVSCGAVTLQPSYTPTTVATAGGYRTIILTNTKRLGPGTTALSATAAGAFGQTLGTFAGRSDVAGAVVDLGADTGVAGAYAQWDATSDSKTCPAAANIVASTIKSVIDAYAAANPGLHYVVIAGGDAVIPYLRVPDQAGLGNEDTFQPPVALDTPSDASLRYGYVLTDGFYGSTVPINRFDHLLYLMDQPTGRLVETPADITAMIAAYSSGYDVATGDVSRPTSALVTGYDFLADTAQFVAQQWSDNGLAVDQSLISSTWTASDLEGKLLGPTKPSYGLVNLNGHFSANTALAADFATRLRTGDFSAFNDGRFTNMLVLSSGCHSGYNIVDDQIVPNVTQPLDWPQLFNGKGATLVGGTGYQYGDTDFRKYTELILSNFAQELRYGTGPVAVGDALASAKRTYLSQVASLSGTDEKALVESTLYGLPMFTVDLPSAGRLARPGTGSAVAPSAGASTGLSVATLTPSYTLTRVDKALNAGAQIASYYDASYGATQHDVQTTPGAQILPRVVQDVHVDNAAARGVVLDHATFTNHSGFFALTDNAAIETSGSRSYFTAPVMTPVVPFNLNTFAGEHLIFTPAQFRSAAAGSPTGVERTLDSQTLRVYYSNRTDAAALAAAPVIYSVNVTADSDPSLVDVDVTIGGSIDPGVETILATYTQDENGTAGTWSSVDLTAGADTANDTYHFVRHYTGTIPSGAAGRDAVRIFIQAVGGNALVSRATNNGAFYSVQAPPTPTVSAPLLTSSLVLSAPASAAYRDGIAVSATLTDVNGAGISGKTVVFSFDGTSSAMRTAITGANGVATAYLRTGSVPGAYTVGAVFNGDTAYLGSEAQRPITVTPAIASLSAVSPAVTQIMYSESAIVATLAGAGRALGMLPLTLTINGTIVPASTDGYGRVRIDTLDPVAAGLNSYAIAFAGNALYTPASLSGTFTLTPAAATVAGVVLLPQSTGVPITVSAVVHELADATPGSLTKAQVRFELVNTDTGISAGVLTGVAAGDGTASVIFPSQPSGLYSIRTTVVGGFYTSSTTSVPLVVYDPSTFVTGGGWLLTASATPVTASTPLPSGKRANFGFTVKYKDGTTVPTGSLLFQLPSASIDLKATSFDWLVTATGHAEFQGLATINGAGSFGYRVIADHTTTSDTFQIRIWDPANGGSFDQPKYVVSNALAGGSLKLH